MDACRQTITSTTTVLSDALSVAGASSDRRDLYGAAVNNAAMGVSAMKRVKSVDTIGEGDKQPGISDKHISGGH